MILPRYSHLLAGLLLDAQVKIYPDSAHGFLFQHHSEFAADVNALPRRGRLTPAAPHDVVMTTQRSHTPPFCSFGTMGELIGG